MLVINKLKPFYIDRNNKELRMGNFKDTGKLLCYENENILSVFENIVTPISKKKLIDKVYTQTKINKVEIEETIQYLIEEGFIIEQEKYHQLIDNKNYNRQNLFFNMISDDFIVYNNSFENKKIMILGLGGVGSNAAIILSRAGFKNFILVDCDKVEISNLIRQFPYTSQDVGKLKTTCLYEKLKNDSNNISIVNKKIQSINDIEKEIIDADFILCTLDKPMRKIRRLINSICVLHKKPVLFCGFSEHVGMIGPFIVPGTTACLMCIEKEMLETPLNNVEIVPSFGPLCLLISSIACNEIINFYANYNKKNLTGKTLMFNFVTYKSKIIKWDKKKNCKECGCHDFK